MKAVASAPVPRTRLEELGHDPDPAEPLRRRRGRRSPGRGCRRARRGHRSPRRRGGRAASARRGRSGRRGSDRGRARTASMSGRSGARPMPPATMTTSRPARVLDRPAAAERSAQAERGARSGASSGSSSRRRRRGSSARCRRGGSARSRSARIANAGHADHDELAGQAGQDPRVVRCQAERRRVGGLGRSPRRPSPRENSSGVERRRRPASDGVAGADRSDGPPAPARRRPAIAFSSSSSRTSMPTGHQATQRPQPTQPDVPNWSHQVANLWVSHWR